MWPLMEKSGIYGNEPNIDALMQDNSVVPCVGTVTSVSVLYCIHIQWIFYRPPPENALL